MTTGDTGGSFLDFLLAGDRDGSLHAIVEADKADLAEGKTWSVYDGDRLVETCPARYIAEHARHDIADAADRDVSDYEIREIEAASTVGSTEPAPEDNP